MTPAQLQDALRFGQALAAWNCGFEGARGGMYNVDKKQFESGVRQIMAGNGTKVPVPDTLSDTVADL